MCNSIKSSILYLVWEQLFSVPVRESILFLFVNAMIEDLFKTRARRNIVNLGLYAAKRGVTRTANFGLKSLCENVLNHSIDKKERGYSLWLEPKRVAPKPIKVCRFWCYCTSQFTSQTWWEIRSHTLIAKQRRCYSRKGCRCCPKKW